MLGEKPNRQQLENFHYWQDNKFHPMQAAVFDQIHKIQAILRAEAPVIYTNEYFSLIKNEQRTLTSWDKYIDLSDVELFVLEP